MLSDLAVTPVAETLRQLSSERRSGDLQVRSGHIVKTLFFDHGRIVFAASNVKKDRLGEALIAVGRITEEEFARASALMKGDRRRRFGEALVQAGIMDKDEVGDSVSRQVKRITLSLFEFAEGVSAFEERRCVIPLEYMVSLSIHRLLYVGIKTMRSRDLVLAGLGNLDRWVILAELPPFRFGIKKCPAEELDILEQCKRKVTLRRLAWASGGLSFTRLRAAYALVASGVLEDAGQAAARHAQPIIQMETSTFLLSALQRKPDLSGREAIHQEVEQELQRSANLDREKWLRLSRTAPRDELVKALEEKMDRYHALLEAVGEDKALKTDIELILGRASSMLRLARQQAPAVPEPASAGPVAAATAAPIPGAAPAGPVGELAGPARVEHLLMEGRVRMTVSDFANAVRIYSQVVELAPQVAPYRVSLAVAMARYPPTARQAERELHEAVRLEPDNAEIHYQFALYYKMMRARSRAIAELRTAVRLEPRHKKARESLETLSPRDSALTSLKKMVK